jgi:hypothetical protein
MGAMPIPALTHRQPDNVQAHWVVEGARTRCVVIAEGDPPPSGSAAGRLSFGGFGELANKKLKDEERQAAAAASEANNTGTSISDEAMATSLTKAQRQQQQQQQQHSGKKHGRPQQGDGRRDRKTGRRGDDDKGGKPKQRARYF